MSESKKQSFKDIFAEMVELGKSIFTEEVKTQKFTDYKAQDGTIIRTEGELKQGAKLQVITPEGVMDLPPDVTEIMVMVGEAPTKVLVEGGVVKEVVPAEQAPATPEQTPQDMGQDFDGKLADLVGRLEKVEQALGVSNQTIATANQTISTANTALEAANKQILAQNELNKQLFGLIQKLADAPAVELLSESKEKQKFKSEGVDLDAFRKKHFQH